MKLYRFSPITDKEQLLQAIEHVHVECYKLCKQSFGEYLPNAGNMGIFCHYDDEFEYLKSVRDDMAHPSNNPDLKYYELLEPIVIPAKDDVPETTYTHLYIRRPDPYRAHVGDVDFFTERSNLEYFGTTDGGSEGVNLRAVEALADCEVANDSTLQELFVNADQALAALVP
jgi:hypothetical protein